MFQDYSSLTYTYKILCILIHYFHFLHFYSFMYTYSYFFMSSHVKYNRPKIISFTFNL